MTPATTWADVPRCSALSPTLGVHWCVVCGPVLMEVHGEFAVVLHKDIEHPFDVTADDEMVRH